MSNLAGIVLNDTANAPGISTSVYISGCDFHCKGCQNQEAWDFNYGSEITQETIIEIEKTLHKDGIERNLCVLGGEPLHRKNLPTTMAIVNWCKMMAPNNKIYLWTGFTLEQLLEKKENYFINELLKNVDVLIDGPYIQELRDVTLPLRGSSNQRIHYLNRSE